MPFSYIADTRTHSDESKGITATAFVPALDRRVWHWDGRFVAGLLLHDGEAEIEMQSTSRRIGPQSLLWVPFKTVARVIVSASAQGIVLTLAPGALDRSMPFRPIAGQIRDATRQSQIHSDLERADMGALSASFDALAIETSAQLAGSAEAADAHLRLIAIRLWRLMQKSGAQSAGQGATDLVQRFFAELDLRLRDQPTVQDLATTLNVSTGRLTRAVQRSTGQSPQQALHAKLMSEAEKLLLESSLQVEQIAALLGFSDPSYFSRFFQKRAGLPPARFRHTRRDAANAAVVKGFSSWP